MLSKRSTIEEIAQHARLWVWRLDDTAKKLPPHLRVALLRDIAAAAIERAESLIPELEAEGTVEEQA